MYQKINIIIPSIGKHIYQVIFHQFKQNWLSDIFDSNKCINYRIFKTELHCEKYLLSLPTKLYSSLLKFRVSNHKLPIERGRHLNIDRNMRKCNLCDMNVICDELHCIFECTAFVNVRKQYLPKYYQKHYNSIKYSNLMNSENINVLIKSSKFTKHIINVYNNV